MVFWNILTKQLLHRERQSLEDLTLLNYSDPFKSVKVIRMHREEADELVHALVHASIEF